MMHTFIECCLCFIVLLNAASISPAGSLRRFESSQPHIGTVARIIVYAPDAATAEKASKMAFERIGELDAILSDYRSDSELNQLCQQAGGPPVKVSKDLFYVLSQAQEMARRSEGAFDITVGPVVRLWRRARRQKKLPDNEKLVRALELVGYQNLRLDQEKQTARLLKEGMLLDLGGIAKGFAADEALKVLKKYGMENALVAVGGDIAVSDPPPGKAGWTVEIVPFKAQKLSTLKPLFLSNAGISTSGDAEQFVDIGGKRYSHIVNPKTGLGMVGRSSVTVVARDATTSDSLATAASVLGPEKGIQLIDSIKTTAALFLQETEEEFKSFPSLRWKEWGF